MALLFHVPFSFWRLLSKQHSIDTKSVMKIIKTMDETNYEEREKSINIICKMIDRSIYINQDWHESSNFVRIKSYVNIRNYVNRKFGYIVRIYMTTKLLYILNVIGQLICLNFFLSSKHFIFGVEFIHDLISSKNFWESSRFPRVTMCDFTIRTLGENNQKNSIQCTLPINLFNEKIFIFIWFWFVLVSLLSIYTTIFWLLDLSVVSRIKFVSRYLSVGDERRKSKDSNEDRYEDFVNHYLKQDGVFILRIVKKNTNDLIVGELISSLWKNYEINSLKVYV
jgi:hypothetical protein